MAKNQEDTLTVDDLFAAFGLEVEPETVGTPSVEGGISASEAASQPEEPAKSVEETEAATGNYYNKLYRAQQRKAQLEEQRLRSRQWQLELKGKLASQQAEQKAAEEEARKRASQGHQEPAIKLPSANQVSSESAQYQGQKSRAYAEQIRQHPTSNSMEVVDVKAEPILRQGSGNDIRTLSDVDPQAQQINPRYSADDHRKRQPGRRSRMARNAQAGSSGRARDQRQSDSASLNRSQRQSGRPSESKSARGVLKSNVSRNVGPRAAQTGSSNPRKSNSQNISAQRKQRMEETKPDERRLGQLGPEIQEEYEEIQERPKNGRRSFDDMLPDYNESVVGVVLIVIAVICVLVAASLLTGLWDISNLS